MIESPAEETVYTRYVEVEGRVGKLSLTPHDVVIAIDFSDSTLAFSGLDLDHDASLGSHPELLARIAKVHGKGSPYHRRFQQNDFDDSILSAELIAARALMERLDSANTRVGVVFFSDRATIAVDLDDTREVAIETIDAAMRGSTRRLGRTNFGAAIRMSIRALFASPARDARGTKRAILILSDGVPTEPVPEPVEAALAATDEAARLCIRIDAYALGEGAAHGLYALSQGGAGALRVYDEIVERTGGTLTRLGTPADIALALHGLSFAKVERLTISNLETGAEAEVIRTTPTGRFDGFLRMTERRNTIQVEVVLSDGTTASEQRVVFYDSSRESDEDTRRAQADLEERIRVHRLRLEFWEEMERVRKSRKRTLTIRPEFEGEGEGEDAALQQTE